MAIASKSRSPGRPPRSRRLISRNDWSRVVRRLRLSKREVEIVQLILDDRKESSIAGSLGISSHTVHTHLERLYRKLGVSSRVGVVVRVFFEFVILHPAAPRG